MHIFWIIIYTVFIIGCIFSIIPYIKFVKNCLKQEKYYEIIGADGLTRLIYAFIGITVLYITLPIVFDFFIFMKNAD